MAKKVRPYCLTIGGFDPSGGAGTIADLKVFEQHNIHGLGALTSNTFQTEDAYFGEQWIETAEILKQVELLFDRYSITHVKIGLTKDVDQLIAILQLLRSKKESLFVLWDPILKPSASNLHDSNRYTGEIHTILQHIDWITPNKPESDLLFGANSPLSDIAHKSNCSIYLKGGHLDGMLKGKDLLFHKTGKVYPFNSKIVTELSKHGSGCVLSSAQLSYFALDFPLVKACLKSKRFMEYYLMSTTHLLGLHKKK